VRTLAPSDKWSNDLKKGGVLVLSPEDHRKTRHNGSANQRISLPTGWFHFQWFFDIFVLFVSHF
jgi:hypothetical protein